MPVWRIHYSTVPSVIFKHLSEHIELSDQLFGKTHHVVSSHCNVKGMERDRGQVKNFRISGKKDLNVGYMSMYASGCVKKKNRFGGGGG